MTYPRRPLVTCLAVILPVFAWSADAKSEPNTLTCALQRAATEFKGSCDVPCLVNALAIDIDGPNPKVTCNAPPRRVAATLRNTDTGANWLGTMEGKFPEDPTRFEIVSGRTGETRVAKTPFGWFAVQTERLEAETLSLSIAANKQLPPTVDDIRIIQRATALLSDEKGWNKEDDRTCLPNPQKWSLFCALEQATFEISGEVHYRQPALQMAREVLNEVGGTRLGKHRLMDYNNHPDTTLADIHNLLGTAQLRLEGRLR
jgi:hypothetical protein